MSLPRSPVAAAALTLLALTVALAAATTVSAARDLSSAAPLERADEEVRRLYEAWKSEHRHGRPRDVVSSDDRLRLEVFRDNLRYIDAHNAEADAGLHTFRLGLTPFADLTLEEYRGRVLGFRGRRGASAARVGSGSTRPRGGDLPDAIDWRELGAVTGVKNQEQCGAYSAPCVHACKLVVTSPSYVLLEPIICS